MPISRDQTFCSAPWTHIHIEPNGSASPCCISGSMRPEDAAYGNLHTDTFAEVINGEGIKNLRKAFLNNERPPVCNNCWKREDTFGPDHSLRNNFNRYRFEERFITDTKPDGSFDDMEILYWDFRPSNLCNFACLMCAETLSSGVWQLREELGLQHLFPNKFNGISKERSDEIFEAMKEQLDRHHSKTQIYFAGGEPLMIPEHHRILEYLIEKEYYDVRLLYNSNLSTLQYKSIDWVDVWKRFDHVEMNASIDASGKPGEFQRLGSNWEVIRNNIKRIHEAGIIVSFNATTSMITYPYIMDTIRDLEEIFDREHLNKYLKFINVEGSGSLDLRMIPPEHFDHTIPDQMEALGYDATIIRGIVDRYDEFNNEKHKMIWRWNDVRTLNDKLRKHKGIGFNDILPWFDDHLWYYTNDKILGLRQHQQNVGDWRCAIDIGSNQGGFSLVYMDHFDKVVAFEPNVELNSKYSGFFGKNDKFTLHNTALHSSEKEMTFYAVRPAHGLSSFDKTWIEEQILLWSENPSGETITPYVLKTRTLDSFNLDPSFIKIDAEGCEIDIIRGAEKTISNYLPTIQIAKSSSDIEELKNLGYICVEDNPDCTDRVYIHSSKMHLNKHTWR